MMQFDVAVAAVACCYEVASLLLSLQLDVAMISQQGAAVLMICRFVAECYSVS